MLLIASLYGAGGEHDAYVAAISLPHFFAALVHGALNKGVVPLFIAARVEGDPSRAWRLAARSAGGLALALLPVGILGAVAPELVARVLFAFGRPETIREAARLISWSLPFAVPLGVAVHLASLHAASGRFLVASASHAIGPAAGLLALTIWHGQLGIAALIMGLLAGTTLQALLLAIPIFRALAKKDGATPGVSTGGRQALVVLGPLLIAGVLQRSLPILEKSFGAKLLDEGSIAQMSCGWKPTMFLFSLIATSIFAAAFPFLSESAAAGDIDALRKRTARITRRLALVLAPVILITILLRGEMMTAVFRRGAFTQHDVDRAALALALYLPAMFLFALNGVVSQVFYALRRVRIFVVAAILGAGSYLIVAPLLAGAFGMPGLVAGYTVASALSFALLLWRAAALLGGIELGALARTALVALPSLAAGGLLVEGARRLLGPTIATIGAVGAIAILIVIGLAGLGIYAAVLRSAGNRDLGEVVRSIFKR